MKLKKLWHRGWKALLFMGAAAIPLSLTVACTQTVSTRVYGVDYEKAAQPEIPGNNPSAYADMHLNEQWPFSLATLNTVADQLSAGTINTNAVKENDIPWRAGPAYESFSQTLSLLRAYVTALGWDPVAEQIELNKTSNGESNMIYLQDADLTTKTNAQLRSEFHSRLSDGYLNNARQWVTATGDDPWLSSFEHQIGAFLQFGDLDIKYDSQHLDLNWITHPPFTMPLPTTDFFPSLESKDVRLYSWNDAQTPGLLRVGLTGVNYEPGNQTPLGRLTRLFTVANRALIYPIIEKTVYDREFVPILRLALSKFLQLFDDTTVAIIASFAGLKIAPDLVSMINFLRKQAPKVDDTQQNRILAQLNNGTHHLLAVAGFWKGFDKSFTRRNSPISAFAATELPYPSDFDTLIQWKYDEGLPGLRDQVEGQSFAIVSGPMNAYFRINQIWTLPESNFLEWKKGYTTIPYSPLWVNWPKFPEKYGANAAFFTNILTYDDMLAANRMVTLRP